MNQPNLFAHFLGFGQNLWQATLTNKFQEFKGTSTQGSLSFLFTGVASL
jgi:hypothetical protein